MTEKNNQTIMENESANSPIEIDDDDETVDITTTNNQKESATNETETASLTTQPPSTEGTNGEGCSDWYQSEYSDLQTAQQNHIITDPELIEFLNNL